MFFLPVSLGQEKTNKHKHFGRDGVRDKHEPSLGQTGSLLGTNWDPSLGQTGLFLLNSTVKSPFCPVCPWDGWGFVPGTIVPQGRSEKCLCVFCLLVLFARFPSPTLLLSGIAFANLSLGPQSSSPSWRKRKLQGVCWEVKRKCTSLTFIKQFWRFLGRNRRKVAKHRLRSAKLSISWLQIG